VLPTLLGMHRNNMRNNEAAIGWAGSVTSGSGREGLIASCSWRPAALWFIAGKRELGFKCSPPKREFTAVLLVVTSQKEARSPNTVDSCFQYLVEQALSLCV
jgi:hypothetical protein